MHSIRKVTEQASTSSSQSDAILDIWIAALSRYKEVAGFDLEKERAGDYRGLEECNSPEDALRVIAGLVDAPHITKQTHLALSNVFRFVLAVNDAVAELAASLVRFDLQKMIFPLISMSSKYLGGKPSSWLLAFCSRYVYRYVSVAIPLC
jgi:hypothetical protein